MKLCKTIKHYTIKGSDEIKKQHKESAHQAQVKMIQESLKSMKSFK